MQNLFEAQAKQDAALARGVNVQPISKLEVAKAFVTQFSLAECKILVDALADRVSDLEGVAFGLEDVAEEIADAIAATEAEPHKAGCDCDACAAAESDILHDRRVDAELMGAK